METPEIATWRYPLWYKLVFTPCFLLGCIAIASWFYSDEDLILVPVPLMLAAFLVLEVTLKRIQVSRTSLEIRTAFGRSRRLPLAEIESVVVGTKPGENSLDVLTRGKKRNVANWPLACDEIAEAIRSNQRALSEHRLG